MANNNEIPYTLIKSKTLLHTDNETRRRHGLAPMVEQIACDPRNGEIYRFNDFTRDAFPLESLKAPFQTDAVIVAQLPARLFIRFRDETGNRLAVSDIHVASLTVQQYHTLVEAANRLPEQERPAAIYGCQPGEAGLFRFEDFHATARPCNYELEVA